MRKNTKYKINCIICGKERILNNSEHNIKKIKCCSMTCSGILRRGRPKTPEEKLKNSTAHLGIKRPPFTAEHLLKLSIAHKGKPSYIRTDEIRKNMSLAHKGKPGRKWTEEQKEHMRNKMKGSNSPSWKGGKILKKEALRNHSLHKQWHKNVFERDNYTCQGCGKIGGYLEVHHIVSLADIVEPFVHIQDWNEFMDKVWKLPIMTDISNGKTLCIPCHKETDSYGPKNRKIYKYKAFRKESVGAYIMSQSNFKDEKNKFISGR